MPRPNHADRLQSAARAKIIAAAASTPPKLAVFTAALPPAPCSEPLQPAPSRSNAPQPAPRSAPAQNEPTTKFLPPDLWQEVLREFRAIESTAQNAPAPTPQNLLQTTPTCSNAHHEPRRRKTNPDPAPSSTFHLPSSYSRPSRPLTPTQLRAARLWFDGHSQAAILQSLTISRHTLARWKRHPDFQAELRRLLDATPMTGHPLTR